MVGGPSLTQADVGIAIGTGKDIAIEAADITLVRGELSGVVSAVKLSRATFDKVVQGLGFLLQRSHDPAGNFGYDAPCAGRDRYGYQFSDGYHQRKPATAGRYQIVEISWKNGNAQYVVISTTRQRVTPTAGLLPERVSKTYPMIGFVPIAVWKKICSSK
jgi:hypothetical protein